MVQLKIPPLDDIPATFLHLLLLTLQNFMKLPLMSLFQTSGLLNQQSLMRALQNIVALKLRYFCLKVAFQLHINSAVLGDMSRGLRLQLKELPVKQSLVLGLYFINLTLMFGFGFRLWESLR
jgi:hypothetical protein